MASTTTTTTTTTTNYHLLALLSWVLTALSFSVNAGAWVSTTRTCTPASLACKVEVNSGVFRRRLQPRRAQTSSPISLSKPAAGTLRATKTESDEANTNVDRINPLVSTILPSKTVEIFSKVKQMQAEGIEVTSLCVGEPDYPPPQAVRDAMVQAVESGQTRYTAVTGTLELREAIAKDMKRRKNVEYDPLTQIIVGNGAKQCVWQGIKAIAGVGDKVLVPAPHWPYPEMVKLTGATPVIVETRPETGYLLTAQELCTALENNPETKMLILCNPSNPTGGVYNRQQLDELVQVLKDFPSVVVLSDEIYERLVYDGGCPAMAAQPGMWERTITINGFSKSHAMTGLRVGYLAAPTDIAKAVTTIQSQLTSCASSISQAAAVAALEQVDDAELDENVRVMREKRDYVLQRLEDMPNVRVEVPPNGAFYVLPDVSAFGDDAELCLDLLVTKQLALVPGTSFGAPGTVRISYATSIEELETAMDTLEGYLIEKT